MDNVEIVNNETKEHIVYERGRYRRTGGLTVPSYMPGSGQELPDAFVTIVAKIEGAGLQFGQAVLFNTARMKVRDWGQFTVDVLEEDMEQIDFGRDDYREPQKRLSLRLNVAEPEGHELFKMAVPDEDVDWRDRLTDAFKKAWHEADELGLEGHRTKAGIAAVLKELGL